MPEKTLFVIVGLGNVGRQYAGSRHNIGFEVVDSLATRYNLTFFPGRGDFFQARSQPASSTGMSFLNWLRSVFGGKASRDSESERETSPRTFPGALIKPTTLMNRSGLAVRQALDLFSVTTQQILVVVDDYNLPLGRLRLRKGGSDGGHNGLKSIIAELETEEFPRLRVGIGPRPGDIDTVGFVLGQFESSHKSLKEAAVNRAADACELLLSTTTAHTLNSDNPLDSRNPLDIVASKYNTDVAIPAPGSDND